eukprot:gnl/TRDRNA2_/TRDRNA2_146469_c1_seq1.p1 gnl/TRDRNA2_/TRDRNA2_146469_c1~~gnl/TRDRNA2_/TRDRNA2_146469_c1_seq1.p1  ORF type:complete len:293 (+),score=39.49 gnl/TRDRNA2_/TRDRNA2_146469_c1_seq1:2-880(+)
MVLQPGCDDSRTPKRAIERRNTGAERGWVKLENCSRLKEQALLNMRRLVDFYPYLPLQTRFATCWKCIYCPIIHGYSLRTFYRQCKAYPGPTLMFLQDHQGAVFGGFASHTWQVSSENVHYGHPDSFVFKFRRRERKDGEEDTEDEEEAKIYPWDGGNECFMFAGRDGFSMGGGDGFAFWVNQNLLRGTSARSSTFGNEILASESEFALRHMECWAFDGPTFGITSTCQSALRSLGGGNFNEEDPGSPSSPMKSRSSVDFGSLSESTEARREIRNVRLREQASEAMRFDAAG